MTGQLTGDAVADNEVRADWARQVLQEFTNQHFFSDTDRDLSDPAAYRQALGDLLCDLMHDAARHDGDLFGQALSSGVEHYIAEITEAAEQ